MGIYRKVLNKEDKKKLGGLTELKVNTSDIEKKHEYVIKAYLDIAYYEILTNEHKLFNRTNANAYLKLCYKKAIMKLYSLELPNISELSVITPKVSITMEKAIEDYISIKTTKDKVSKGTINNYRTYKNRVYAYFKTKKDIFDLDYKQAEAFQLHLSKNISNGGVDNTIAFLGSVLDYLKNTNEDLKNPFDGLKYMPQVESEKEPFSNQDINDLLSECQDKNIELSIMLGIYSGFRIGEILSLQIENIDLEHDFIYSKLKDTGTKKHTRIIPIHKNIKSFLVEMIGTKKSGRLIYNNDKRGEGYLQNIINNYIRSIIPSKTKSFHSTRSAFAKMIEDFNEKDIKILIGHKAKGILAKSYLKSDTNWNKKVEMINQISYQNTKISDTQIAINNMISKVA